MQNQSNSLITFDTQLKTALITSLPVHFVHKSHNTSLRHPRNLHRHFFWGGGGVIEVYYGIVQVVNSLESIWVLDRAT